MHKDKDVVTEKKENEPLVLHLFKAGFHLGRSRSCIQKHRAMRSSETGPAQ